MRGEKKVLAVVAGLSFCAVEIVEKVLKKVGEGRAVCVEKWGWGRKKLC